MASKKQLNTLYPIDSFGIQRVSLSGIRVEKLESRINPAVPFPHKHDFFQVLLLTKGSGKHQIDFKVHALKRNQVYVMKPGQMHSWSFNSAATGILVEFSYQSLNSMKESSQLIHQLSFTPDQLKVTKKTDLTELFTQATVMLKESEEKRKMYDLCLQGLLASFIINLIRVSQKEPKHEKLISSIERFRKLVEENFRSAHTVEFYAKELKTSPNALTMQLTRAMGKPPRQIIQDRILLEAKRYLAFSDLSIAEVGYELGFDDPNYFTRFFRLHEKKTPAAFRKEAIIN